MRPELETAPAVSGRHARLLRHATYASTATATVLIFAKAAVWIWTDSVSLLASLIDSLMDAMASLVNLYAVRFALTPADEEHRFGHGKAESLAGLGQAAFIAGSALFLVLHAVDRLLNPLPLKHTGAGIVVMVVSLLLTLLLLAFQHHVIRRTGSLAIRADALHYATDVLTNCSIIVALLLVQLGFPASDALFGLAIAAYILYSAWRIGAEALKHLMDHELEPRLRAQICAIAHTESEVLGVHGLRTRRSGPAIFVQLHLELDAGMSLERAHAIADRVEQGIRAALPEADVIIHQDPVSHGGDDAEHVQGDCGPT